jgi:putative oxidoreductase
MDRATAGFQPPWTLSHENQSSTLEGEKPMTTAATLTNRSQSSTQVLAISGPLVLLGRFLFALIFLMAGPNHFSGQTIAMAASAGVPLASIGVPFSGVIAILGGLSILLGYRAKLGAWLIVLFLIAITPAMHKFWTVPDPTMHMIQMVMFMKNLTMLGGALLITQFGSGPWSLDNRK